MSISIRTPLRTLTVTSGRDTVGFIHEMQGRRYSALLASTGKTVGVFATTAEAATALADAHREIGGVA